MMIWTKEERIFVLVICERKLTRPNMASRGVAERHASGEKEEFCEMVESMLSLECLCK